MEFRLNIGFSFFVHAVLIAAAFSVGFREAGPRVPEPYLLVTLLEGFSDSRPLAEVKAAPKDKGRTARPRKPTPAQTALPVPVLHHNTAQDKKEQEDPALPPREALPSSSGNTASPVDSHHGQSQAGGKGVSLSGGHDSSLTVEQISGGQGRDNQASQGRSEGGTHSDAVRMIRTAIERALVYPQIAKKRGIEGTSLTGFSINSRGYPENIRIIQSSGSGILDTAARETVDRAAPFPAVGGSLEIPISFRLKNN